MKLKSVIATAAAVLAMATAGSAFASTTYNLASGTPTLTGGDQAFADLPYYFGAFTKTYDFDLASVGSTGNAYTSIIAVAFTNQPSITNLVTSFEDLTTGMSAGSFGGTGSSTVALTSGHDYAVTFSGTGNSTFGGSADFDLRTAVAPVPGPEGFAVAIAGMGALFLVRRRAARRAAV